MTFQPVYIVASGRTAIGSFHGSLASLTPATLGAICAKQVLERSNVPADQIDEVIVGNVLAAGHGMNVSRQVGKGAGLPDACPAFTINRVCGSGLQAVMTAASSIRAGQSSAVLCGGTESMSQAMHVLPAMRSGTKLGHTECRDLLLQDGLTDAFISCHMGVTAENLAERFGISRAEQDQFAFESQQKAAHAQQEGWFAQEICPVPLEKRGKPVGSFEKDEYIRADSSLEALAALRPAFKKEGSVTAGNASGINDGAAFLLVAGGDFCQAHGLKPIAEIVEYGAAGVAPEVMGIGPVEAVNKVMTRSKIKLNDIDVIEANEAFAVQALAVARELKFDSSKVNLGGGAIALGHPIGASGARVLVTLLGHLTRTGQELGLATLCVGGGQGVAMVVRRC